MVPTESAFLRFFILILCTVNGLHSFPRNHPSLGILNELIGTDSKSPLIVVVDSNNQVKNLDHEQGRGQIHSKSCPNHPDHDHRPSHNHGNSSPKFSNQDYEGALYELLRNILPSLTEEYSGLLSNLYKKASDQNRPLILVLDNNANRNSNYKESESHSSNYKSKNYKSNYPVNSNYKSSSYSNRNDDEDNRKENGPYPFTYLYRLAKQMKDHINQDIKPSKSYHISSHSSNQGNNQNAWENKDSKDRARDYKDRKNSDYRGDKYYTADRYYKSDSIDKHTRESYRGDSYNRGSYSADSSNRNNNDYNRNYIDNNKYGGSYRGDNDGSYRGDSSKRGTYRGHSHNKGRYRGGNNNRGSYSGNRDNRGSYLGGDSNMGSNRNNYYYKGDNRIDYDYRGDNRWDTGDGDYRGYQKNYRYDNELLKSSLVKTLMDISNNLRQGKDSCEDVKQTDESTTTTRYQVDKKSDNCDSSGSCADSDDHEKDKNPSTKAEHYYDACLNKPKSCNSLKK